MTILEKEVEGYLKRQVEVRGGLCIKWTSPGTTGLPDRIILLPGGRVIFAEMKRAKGSRVGALQSYWRSVLQRMGFAAYTLYTKSEVDAMLIAEGSKHDRTV